MGALLSNVAIFQSRKIDVAQRIGFWAKTTRLSLQWASDVWPEPSGMQAMVSPDAAVVQQIRGMMNNKKVGKATRAGWCRRSFAAARTTAGMHLPMWPSEEHWLKRWSWLGHVPRLPEQRHVRKMMNSSGIACFSLCGRTDGNIVSRKRQRTMLGWVDTVLL